MPQASPPPLEPDTLTGPEYGPTSTTCTLDGQGAEDEAWQTALAFYPDQQPGRLHMHGEGDWRPPDLDTPPAADESASRAYPRMEDSKRDTAPRGAANR